MWKLAKKTKTVFIRHLVKTKNMFFKKEFSAINLIVRTAFTVSHKFWCCIFIVVWFILFKMFSWALCCVELCCLISRYSGVLFFSSLSGNWLISSERRHYKISIWDLLKCVLWCKMWYVLVNECAMWVWEVYILLLLDTIVCRCQLYPPD